MPSGVYPRTSPKQGFQKGHKINVGNKWNIGRIPWCKGKKIPQNSGERNHMWRGGRSKRPDGYIVIYKPEHPSVIQRKTITKHARLGVFEHRLVMEKMIGRYLTNNELVHHKNGIKDDNRPENLVLTVKGKNWHPHICPKCGFEFLIK